MPTGAVRIVHLCAEALIQSLVFTIIICGAYTAIKNIGYDWLVIYKGQVFTGSLYILVSLLVFPLLLYTYTFLVLGRTIRDVPNYPKPDVSSLKEPYECNNDTGELGVCHKGKCAGKWKPPKSHHCSTCGVCRLEFDHHCPWIGNCVTSLHLKDFLLLLSLTAFIVPFAVAPIASTLWKHITLAYTLSVADKNIQRQWWNWWGSWIFCGGPPGRYIIGTLRGFALVVHSAPPYQGQRIEEPNLAVAILIFFACFLAAFTLALVISITKDLAKGMTTLDTMSRRRHRWIHLPSQRTVPISPEDRVYDLGPQKNIFNMLRRPLFSRSLPQLYDWPEINPVLLKRISVDTVDSAE